MTLLLRPPTVADEAAARRLHTQLAADDFDFLLHDGSWGDFLAKTAREAAGVDLPAGRVPADFLLAEVDAQLVGRVSIRHELNDHLRNFGGHVGYAVGPQFRRRGYATEILRQSVARLAGLGVAQVLVTCDEGNTASVKTIEACGGVLDDVVTRDEGGRTRRYWITAA